MTDNADDDVVRQLMARAAEMLRAPRGDDPGTEPADTRIAQLVAGLVTALRNGDPDAYELLLADYGPETRAGLDALATVMNLVIGAAGDVGMDADDLLRKVALDLARRPDPE